MMHDDVGAVAVRLLGAQIGAQQSAMLVYLVNFVDEPLRLQRMFGATL